MENTNELENGVVLPNLSKYIIMDDGRIISRSYYRLGKPKQMKVFLDKSGYYKIQLYSDDRKQKTIKVHRLVALAFLDNPEKLPQINHIDGDKKNNNVSNLEWCTAKHNMRHAFRTGLNRVLHGEETSNNKLTSEEVMKIKELIHQGSHDEELAKQFNVTRTTIRSIRVGKTWPHVEYWVRREFPIYKKGIPKPTNI